MPTSKLTSLYISILVGTLLLISVLSMPAPAKAGDLGDSQQDIELVPRQPTRTKRPKNVRATPTPRPANTATSQPPTRQSTSVVVASATSVQTETPVGTGTSISTSLPTSTFSSDLNTVVAQLTATSGVVQMTSTSMALTATSTPTLMGAPTSTPGDLDLTATSIVETTVPLQMNSHGTATGSPTATSVDYQVPITAQRSNSFHGSTGVLWLFLGGAVVLVFLVSMLARELRKAR